MSPSNRPARPGAGENQAVLPLKLKQRLYPAVLELFSQRDFHQVTLRDICRLSGLSPSTIYQYYSSKENLVFSILDEKIGEIGPLVREHIQGLESVREIFRKVFWVTMDYYDRNPGVAITAFITLPMRTWMSDPAYAKKEVGVFFRELVELGRGRDELDPAVRARQVVDLYYMFCYRRIHLWFFKGRQERLVDSIPGFFPLFWKTISKIKA
ncbi:MAG: TetR/AcrR family transcriptional regulator [Pseudomonadota bacterium]